MAWSSSDIVFPLAATTRPSCAPILDQTFVRGTGHVPSRPVGPRSGHAGAAGSRVHNGVRAHPPPRPVPRPSAPSGPRTSQRQHILSTALSLMATQGVDGTSMRNLATATGLNVASLYHYFPSKRDLLVAVLEERGFVDDPARLAAVAVPRPGRRAGRPAERHPPVDARGGGLRPADDGRGHAGRRHGLRRRERPLRRHPGLPRASGWPSTSRPLCRPGQQAALARMLRSLLVGLFFEHVAGVLGDDEPSVVFRARADEVAALLAIEPPD